MWRLSVSSSLPWPVTRMAFGVELLETKAAPPLSSLTRSLGEAIPKTSMLSGLNFTLTTS